MIDEIGAFVGDGGDVALTGGEGHFQGLFSELLRGERRIGDQPRRPRDGGVGAPAALDDGREAIQAVSQANSCGRRRSDRTHGNVRRRQGFLRLGDGDVTEVEDRRGQHRVRASDSDGLHEV